jgi:hypothetical protein
MRFKDGAPGLRNEPGGGKVAIDQIGVIDMMSFDKNKEKVVLTISDHLEWSQSVEHQQILQSKFNTYFAFVESGQLVDQYPEAKGLPVVFRVVFKYRPGQEGRLFIERARKVIESAGFTLSTELFAESYDN